MLTRSPNLKSLHDQAAALTDVELAKISAQAACMPDYLADPSFLSARDRARPWRG